MRSTCAEPRRLRRVGLVLGILIVFHCAGIAQSGKVEQKGWRERIRQGEQLYLQHRYAEADASFREAMKTPEYLTSEVVRFSVRCDLGVVATNLGRYDQAERLLSSCPTSTPAERLVRYINLATLYSYAGRYSEAESFYLKAEVLIGQEGTISAGQCAIFLEDRGLYALRKGDFRQAETLLREARDLYAQTGIEWDSAATSGNLAVTLIKENHLVDARAELGRAIDEIEILGGTSHPMLAGVLGCLAEIDRREGRFADAESRLKRALAIATADSPDLRDLLWMYASTLRRLKHIHEARVVEKRAQALSPIRPSPTISVNELQNQSRKR
jgi:tetratricopeptide (TPR) repeat protein